MSEVEGSKVNFPVPEINQLLQSYTASPANAYAPVITRTIVQEFNDREMATSYLLTLKRSR